jgi:hypothetical protein
MNIRRGTFKIYTTRLSANLPALKLHSASSEEKGRDIMNLVIQYASQIQIVDTRTTEC